MTRTRLLGRQERGGERSRERKRKREIGPVTGWVSISAVVSAVLVSAVVVSAVVSWGKFVTFATSPITPALTLP